MTRHLPWLALLLLGCGASQAPPPPTATARLFVVDRIEDRAMVVLARLPDEGPCTREAQVEGEVVIETAPPGSAVPSELRILGPAGPCGTTQAEPVDLCATLWLEDGNEYRHYLAAEVEASCEGPFAFSGNPDPPRFLAPIVEREIVRGQLGPRVDGSYTIVREPVGMRGRFDDALRFEDRPTCSSYPVIRIFRGDASVAELEWMQRGAFGLLRWGGRTYFAENTILEWRLRDLATSRASTPEPLSLPDLPSGAGTDPEYFESIERFCDLPPE